MKRIDLSDEELDRLTRNGWVKCDGQYLRPWNPDRETEEQLVVYVEAEDRYLTLCIKGTE